MSEPPYNRLPEDKAGRGTPAGQGPPSQHVYPLQYGFPPQNTNQQIGVMPTTTIITRDVQAQPEDYLALSIFVLICCCLPLGIVAVINANEVGSRFKVGDYDGAVESSRQAKSWAMGGLITGIVLWSIAAVCVIAYIIIIAVTVKQAVEEVYHLDTY